MSIEIADIPEPDLFGRPDHLAFLASLNQDFAASLDFDRTIEWALRGITEIMHAEAGALFLLEDNGRDLVCKACVGPVDVRGVKIRMGEGVVGRSVQNNRVEVVNNAYENPNFHRDIDLESGFSTRMILCAPMKVGDRMIGAIEVLNKRDGSQNFEAQDVHLISAMTSAAGLGIANARMAAALLEQERTRRELELAAEIQRNLLPKPQKAPFPVRGINKPMRKVSGDFFDFMAIDERFVAFALGDVSGKGMDAALMMAKTASLFRCLGKSITDPGHLLTLINREVCETTSHGKFVTMVAGIYDLTSGALRFANAGHEPPVLRDQDGAISDFPADAPPLGILPEQVFETLEISIAQGDFYVFSDGLTEHRDGAGGILEAEGVMRIIAQTERLPLDDRLPALFSLLDAMGHDARDDMTMLAVHGQIDAVQKKKRPLQSVSDPLNDMDFLAEIRVPAEANRLKIIRETTAHSARHCGFDEKETQDIILAVDEACQNIIRHAYRDVEQGEFILTIHQQSDGICFLLRDFGPLVDPSKIVPRDLDDVRPGGLGTHFINVIMESADFLPAPDGVGNLLRMVKKIGTRQ